MTKKSSLTDTKLKKLLRADLSKQESHSVGLGLSIRVTPSKRDSGNVRPDNNLLWLYRYRVGDRTTSPKALTLGKYPEISLSQATTLRDECRKWLAAGKDPKNELAIQKQDTLKPLTVKQGLELWLSDFNARKRVNAEKHFAQFRKYLLPTLSDLPLEQITKPMWIRCLHRSDDKWAVARGYTLNNLKQALRFLKKQGYKLDTDVFEIDFDDIGAAKQKKSSRAAVEVPDGEGNIEWDELCDLVEFSFNGKMVPYYQNLLQVLLVMGARTQEVRLSKSSEWDLKRRVWTCPAEHNKVKEKAQQAGGTGDIVRPIPEFIYPLIESLVTNNPDGYLLGELKQAPAVSAWGGKLSQRIGWISDDEVKQYKQVGKPLKDHPKFFRLHHLRHTFSTALNELQTDNYAIEMMLGHALPRIEGNYNNSSAMKRKANLLRVWCSHIEKLLERGEQASNVVSFGGNHG